jgi:hypothetical protein
VHSHLIVQNSGDDFLQHEAAFSLDHFAEQEFLLSRQPPHLLLLRVVLLEHLLSFCHNSLHLLYQILIALRIQPLNQLFPNKVFSLYLSTMHLGHEFGQGTFRFGGPFLPQDFLNKMFDSDRDVLLDVIEALIYFILEYFCEQNHLVIRLV